MASNCLSFWFPRVRQTGAKVPRTFVFHAPCMVDYLIDGKTPVGFYDLVSQIAWAVEQVGCPAFLRSGQTSGKHDWNQTSFLRSGDRNEIARHVGAVTEYSHMVDFMGLDTSVWVVREFLKGDVQFHAFRESMPVVREFRLRVESRKIVPEKTGDTLRDAMALHVSGNSHHVTHVQPYWPKRAITHPTTDDWEERLSKIAAISDEEFSRLESQAVQAMQFLGGDWSMDWFQTADGQWWLTDMAIADQSFWYSPDDDFPEWASPNVPRMEFREPEPEEVDTSWMLAKKEDA